MMLKDKFMNFLLLNNVELLLNISQKKGVNSSLKSEVIYPITECYL